MKFFIPINEPQDEDGEGNGSVTIHVVDTGSDIARTNRRKLREYFTAMGVHAKEMKSVFKKMGFTREQLGR